MTVEIILSFKDEDAAIAFLLSQKSDAVISVPEGRAEVVSIPTPKPVKAPKNTVVAPLPPTVSEVASTAPVTYETSGLAPRIAALAAGTKKSDVVSLLGSFGVKSGRLLKPEQLAAFDIALKLLENEE